jgi:glycosyltransferase involved in cell wall biosynthesis
VTEDTTPHEATTDSSGDAEPVASPLVSVIVPTRDRPEMLRRTLDAIVAQDYPGDVEVLVVFDQSEPDRTIEQNGARRSVRTLRNTRTPGLAGARNSGILAASGALIAFCDDDDVWVASKLRAQVAALAAAPAAGVATAGIVIRYADRSVTRIPDAAELTFQGLLRDRVTAAHPSTFLVRREALDVIGLVDEDLPGSYAEDHDWLLRAARHSRIVSVPEPLVLVEWGATSFFADRWQMIIAAMDALLAKHPEFADEPLGLARLYGRKAFAYAALGERAQARRWARQSLRHNWRDQRALVALLVSTGLVSASTAMRLAHQQGRGI